MSKLYMLAGGIVELGGSAAITQPKAEWIADLVRRHLRDAEGVEV